jgi:hypothetical protein
MKGIPDKFKKKIETLMWDFIWEGKVNQIKRDVCCLDIENGANPQYDNKRCFTIIVLPL